MSRAVAAVLAVALAVRIVVVLTSGHFMALTDAGDFDRNGLALALNGHLPGSVLTLRGGPTAFRPPAFSALLAVVDRVVGPGSATARWEAARLVEAGLGTVTVGLLIALGVRLFPGPWGRRVALGAGAVAAIDPPLVLAGSSLLSESLFLPVTLAAALAGLGARERLDRTSRRAGLGGALLTGVLVGIAALSRSNGLVIAPALLWLVWSPVGGRGPGWRRRLRRRALAPPALLALGVAVVIVPWTIRNAEVFDGALVPTTTQAGYALAGVYNARDQSDRVPYPGFWRPPVAQMAAIERKDPGIDEAAMSSRLAAIAFGYVRAHPFSVLREGWASLRGLLGLRGAAFERFLARLLGESPTLAVIALYAFWPVAGLALVGAWMLWRGRLAARRHPGTGAVWAIPVLLFLSVVLVSGEARYRVPVDPFLLLLGAAAVGGALARPAIREGATEQPLASPRR